LYRHLSLTSPKIQTRTSRKIQTRTCLKIQKYLKTRRSLCPIQSLSCRCRGDGGLRWSLPSYRYRNCCFPIVLWIESRRYRLIDRYYRRIERYPRFHCWNPSFQSSRTLTEQEYPTP
jgi:hypothetical protein